MFIFIDETWQTSPDGKQKIAVLAAIAIRSDDYNICSNEIFKIKLKTYRTRSQKPKKGIVSAARRLQENRTVPPAKGQGAHRLRLAKIFKLNAQQEVE